MFYNLGGKAQNYNASLTSSKVGFDYVVKIK